MIDSVKLRAVTYDSKIITMQQLPEKKDEEHRASEANNATSLDDGNEARQWALSVVLAFESMSRVIKLTAEREKDTPHFEEERIRLGNFVILLILVQLKLLKLFLQHYMNLVINRCRLFV